VKNLGSSLGEIPGVQHLGIKIQEVAFCGKSFGSLEGNAQRGNARSLALSIDYGNI
jgi:hypothetical protein